MAITPAARAVEAVITDVSVSLPLPAGFCELSESDRSDKRLMYMIANPQESWRLSISADCGQLADWRAGKRRLFDDYAQYLNSEPVTGSIQGVCTLFRGTSPNKIVPDYAPDIKAAAEATLQFLKGLKRPSGAPIGVLAEDTDTCYGAYLGQPGPDTFGLDMAAHTKVKNKRLQYHRIMLYKGPDSVLDALAKLKEDVAALHAANR
ncbi:MAG: hypothetical protein ACLPX9_22510 [Rhodomicrobium sp.]